MGNKKDNTAEKVVENGDGDKSKEEVNSTDSENGTKVEKETVDNGDNDNDDSSKNEKEANEESKVYTEKEFKDTVSAAVEEAIKSRLDRDSQKTQIEELNKSVEELKEKLVSTENNSKKGEAEALKLSVALEKELSKEVIQGPLYTGNTREELEASADAILSLMKKEKKNDSVFESKQYGDKESPEERTKRLRSKLAAYR